MDFWEDIYLFGNDQDLVWGLFESSLRMCTLYRIRFGYFCEVDITVMLPSGIDIICAPSLCYVLLSYAVMGCEVV